MAAPHQAYRQLLRKLSRFFARAQRRYPEQLRCGPSCDSCCQRDLALFPIEVDLLAEAVGRLPAKTQAAVRQRAQRAAKDTEAPCPLLGEGRCLVYEARPVICRTQGLPLLVTVPGAKPELSVCPQNFHGVDRIAGDCVLDLTPVNQILATVNHLACSQAGRSPERIQVGNALSRRRTRKKP